MGNSPLASGCQHSGEDRHAAAEPRLLAQLRGDLIGIAMRGLPPATHQGQTGSVESDFEGVGRVRIHATAKKYPRRGGGFFWAMERAEMVSQA